MSWLEKARCRNVDPEIFFPVAGEGSPVFEAQSREARAVCAFCPVTAECLELAVRTRAEGIWAGTSPGERRLLRVAVA